MAWWQVAEGRPTFLQAGPVPRPSDWLEWIQQPITVAELTALRQSVIRGAPYGEAAWRERMAKRLGLESTPRPPGRPRKQPAEAGAGQ